MKKLVFLATTMMFTAGYTACGRMEREHDNNENREQGIKMHRRGMMNRGRGRMMQNRRWYNADDQSKSKTKTE